MDTENSLVWLDGFVHGYKHGISTDTIKRRGTGGLYGYNNYLDGILYGQNK